MEIERFQIQMTSLIFLFQTKGLDGGNGRLTLAMPERQLSGIYTWPGGWGGVDSMGVALKNSEVLC